MRRQIEIGLLFSCTASYGLIAEAGRAGALRAIDEVNADPAFDLTFIPVERDPQGNIDLYQPMCAEILRSTSARHVIGTTTSWSRKEVIPTLEKVDGILWYPCPHEGFEASDHVVYMHACPNQHLVPLMDWALPRYGRRAYLVGSNYIWGWEINRVARDLVMGSGGTVLGERYLRIGDTDVARMIEEIRATRPDFVLNSLIGSSSYAFLAAMAELRREDSAFGGGKVPVLSCNLTECELPKLGADAEGLISAGPYFHGAAGWPGGGRVFASSFEAAAYVSVRALAGLLAHRPGAETLCLRSLLDQPKEARFGIDRATHHVTLPALIAEVQQGRFEVISARDGVEPDPYLSRRSNRLHPNLTVVTP
ncbi:transporter substrate-binding protein [Pararhodobacter oceanensis]|uniref:transporter substrate-binding protein n=1 Tax=Pararhodobacter oceanensis TaxID=2172121 RepID=UPI003A90AE1E